MKTTKAKVLLWGVISFLLLVVINIAIPDIGLGEMIGDLARAQATLHEFFAVGFWIGLSFALGYLFQHVLISELQVRHEKSNRKH